MILFNRLIRCKFSLKAVVVAPASNETVATLLNVVNASPLVTSNTSASATFLGVVADLNATAAP
jgi:hypothetical protein